MNLLVSMDRYEGMKKILNQKNPPMAVLITDDLIVLGAMKAVSEKEVKIPEEISIMSFNNIYICQLTAPLLTSIEVHSYDLGFYAAKILFQKIKGKETLTAIKKIIDTEIIHRNSVAKINV